MVKIERAKAFFNPITITLETMEEAIYLWNCLNEGMTPDYWKRNGKNFGMEQIRGFSSYDFWKALNRVFDARVFNAKDC